ncbi:MAG: glycosyltransferase [Xanthomonadales bacterium]|nr:glycosyltransferase [Xanthomonadales bacterium]
MNSSPQPRFSIVIPTYQRPEGLHNCLAAIAAMASPKNEFEVIVVDDANAGNTHAVTEPFKPDLNLTLIRQDNQGPASARNAGARRARGDYLLFIDDDCVPGPKWMECIAAALGDEPRLAVGGRCRNGLETNIFASAQQMLMDYLHQHYNNDPTHARFCPSNSLAVPRQAFLDLGGFDTGFSFAGGEDRDFSARWIESNAQLVFSTDVHVLHMHHMGFLAFIKMNIHYGRGARRFHLKTTADGKRRGLESARFYVGLITFPFAHQDPVRATVLCGLQILGQLAHAGGYLAESFSAATLRRSA